MITLTTKFQYIFHLYLAKIGTAMEISINLNRLRKQISTFNTHNDEHFNYYILELIDLYFFGMKVKLFLKDRGFLLSLGRVLVQAYRI